MDEHKMFVTITFIIAAAIVSAAALFPIYYGYKNYLLERQYAQCTSVGKVWQARDTDPDKDYERIVWECR
jgi:hypothetical protein